jgi:hypothetical protein
MLQIFYIDVAKVDWDIAHIAMAIHVRFKCMFQIFHLFQTYVTNISFRCCKTQFRIGKSLIDLHNYWGWSSLLPQLWNGLIYPLNFAKLIKSPLKRFWTAVCYSNNGFATVTVVLSISF